MTRVCGTVFCCVGVALFFVVQVICYQMFITIAIKKNIVVFWHIYNSFIHFKGCLLSISAEALNMNVKLDYFLGPTSFSGCLDMFTSISYWYVVFISSSWYFCNNSKRYKSNYHYIFFLYNPVYLHISVLVGIQSFFVYIQIRWN